MTAFLAGLALGAAACGVAAWLAVGARDRRLGRFMSFAAHEINTPITAMNMTVLNLLEGVFGPLPPDQLPWVEMMREQISRLNGMVGELRDMIHMELQKNYALRLEEASAEDVVQGALRNVKHGCAHAGIEISVDVASGLPPLSADPDRLTRTLSSVLFYARKFRAAGPLLLAARPDSAGVELVVSFEGSALSAEDAARSLDLYDAARPRKNHGMAATGLGLGILRAVMRRQGGDLELKVDGRRQTLILRVPAGPLK